MNHLSKSIRCSCRMRAAFCSAAAALHDHPPVDKPHRLPLRERWQADGPARGGGAR